MISKNTLFFIGLLSSFVGLASPAILTGRSELDNGQRYLSKDAKAPVKSKYQLAQERDAALRVIERERYRQQASDHFDQCFSLETFRKNRPDKGKKPLTDTDRDRIAQENWESFQKSCLYQYFRGQAALPEEHINLSTKECNSMHLFSILQSNGLFLDDCHAFAVAMKNYGYSLISLKQGWAPKDDFDSYFKTYNFGYADRAGIITRLTSTDQVSSLIYDTVVRIHKEDKAFKGNRFLSGDGSGNLVDFDPETLTFSNICPKGAKTHTLNFLLTAAHCMKEIDEKLIKPDVKPASIVMASPVALISMKYYFDSNRDERALKPMIMTDGPGSTNDDDKVLQSKIPLVEAGVKVVGQDVYTGLFMDKDTVVVKLARPVEIQCPGNGQEIDFSNANPDKQARERTLKLTTNDKTDMALYGFPGSYGPFKMPMHPLKFEITDLEYRAEGYAQAVADNIVRLSKSFTLEGSALNGASGGPLFIHQGSKLLYVATVIRGSPTRQKALEANFNARKVE